MATEILSVRARAAGTAKQPYNTVLIASHRKDFDAVCDVRILAITASGWLLAMRNSAEGGSRNSTPMFGVGLVDRNEQLVGDVVGPVQNSLLFTGISRLTVWVRVAHFLLADPIIQAIWRYEMVAACYYELA